MFVLDGEIVVEQNGAHDFSALFARIHPAATRVERLRRETPAAYVAFDVLATDEGALIACPFRERGGSRHCSSTRCRRCG